MKIAICLSGFIRTWEHSKLSFIKNLIQDLDCDIFIHTYKQNYYEYSSHNNFVIYTNIIFGGRLSEYRYYDMHQIVGSALVKVKKELEKN